MTKPLKRTFLAAAFALAVGGASPLTSVAHPVEPTTGEVPGGSFTATAPSPLGIEATGGERTIAQGVMGTVSVGPPRPACPPPGEVRTATALAASRPTPSGSGLSSAEVRRAEAPAPERATGTGPAAVGLAPPHEVTAVETAPAIPPPPATSPTPPRPTFVAQAPAAGRQGAANAPGDYKIGPEDILDIAVWNNTAISRTVPVRPDGKISLPLLNDLQAAGLTPMQLREVLARKLAEYMPAPEVSVIVREVHSFKVSVLGEVRKAGQYELKSRSTVLDLIALAGGFTEFAARSRIVILRQDGGTIKRVPFNYNKAISPDAPQADLFVQPGDVVVVP